MYFFISVSVPIVIIHLTVLFAFCIIVDSETIVFHVEQGDYMNTLQLRAAIEDSRVKGVEIGACSTAPGWIVFVNTWNGGGWLERARGGRAIYQSVDAAHTAIRRAGWHLEVQLTV